MAGLLARAYDTVRIEGTDIEGLMVDIEPHAGGDSWCTIARNEGRQEIYLPLSMVTPIETA